LASASGRWNDFTTSESPSRVQISRQLTILPNSVAPVNDLLTQQAFHRQFKDVSAKIEQERQEV